MQNLKLKIGIDISQIVYETGVSTYTKNLVKALLKRAEDDKFVLFGGSLRKKTTLNKFVESVSRKNVIRKTYPIPPMMLSFLWNDLHILPIEYLIGKVDIFHSSDWTQPPTKAAKITTIHDLVPLRFPKITSPKIVEVHKKRLSWVKREVDKIITVSTFTKNEIVDLLDIDPQKITIIPEAADVDFKKSSLSEITRTKEKFGIKKEYLLVVGTDPRKNIPAIIQAFERIKKEKNLELVIIGFLQEKINTTEDIIFTGHVTMNELQDLYSGAETLVYTCLYEGFGLPILEAMKLDCPVVTSNISSMPEVAGDAAVLADPTNPKNIANSVLTILEDRKIWVEKGRRREREFNWQDTADLTMRVYREIF